MIRNREHVMNNPRPPAKKEKPKVDNRGGNRLADFMARESKLFLATLPK